MNRRIAKILVSNGLKLDHYAVSMQNKQGAYPQLHGEYIVKKQDGSETSGTVRGTILTYDTELSSIFREIIANSKD